MELELATALTNLRDTALTIVLVIPAIGITLLVLKEALGLDRWRL